MHIKGNKKRWMPSSGQVVGIGFSTFILGYGIAQIGGYSSSQRPVVSLPEGKMLVVAEPDRFKIETPEARSVYFVRIIAKNIKCRLTHRASVIKKVNRQWLILPAKVDLDKVADIFARKRARFPLEALDANKSRSLRLCGQRGRVSYGDN